MCSRRRLTAKVQTLRDVAGAGAGAGQLKLELENWTWIWTWNSDDSE